MRCIVRWFGLLQAGKFDAHQQEQPPHARIIDAESRNPHARRMDVAQLNPSGLSRKFF
jgi:hypothetical protein